MRKHKIIYLLGALVIFCSPAQLTSPIRDTPLTEDGQHNGRQTREAERINRLKKQQQPLSENITVPEDDEEKKTLAQQVLDGKYGLIQTELFSSPAKRPGILSYEVNPEVPKDNINNLGGLKPEEIWLAENHLLVLKGGGFSEMEQMGKVSWPPIDNYIAPQRQVKIPPNPKIPPPFPIQLKEGGPIEVIKGKNNTKTFPPYFNGGPFGPPFLIPLTPNVPSGSNNDFKQGQGNFTQGNGGVPFPYLPPELGLYPPAIAFLPPPGNLTELDEDDPRIYYPPRYDFVYKKNYTSHVPPGPLVPGIILPPPPNFFAPLENNTRKPRPNQHRDSLIKNSKQRLNAINSSRHKIVPQSNNYKNKNLPVIEQKVISPIHVVSNNKQYAQPISKSNKTHDEWMPIPAPRPFYITDINKLKAITNNRGNDQSYQYVGPKNGWDYENVTTTEISKITPVQYNKNSEREKTIKEIYYKSENDDNNLKTTSLPKLYTTEINDNHFKPNIQPQLYTTERYESNFKYNPRQYYTTEKTENNLKSNIFSQNKVNKFEVSSVPTIIVENDENYANNNDNSPQIRGKLLRPAKIESPHRVHGQYIYNRPFDELNTFVPQRIYSDTTIKTPPLNGRIILPNIKYGSDYKDTVKPTSKPLSFLYYEQDSKYQDDGAGYNYDVPVRSTVIPFRQEQYKVLPPTNDLYQNIAISSTKKPPIYEYSYSAPGYGTVEAPKVGHNIVTTPKPVVYETNFKPIKQAQYDYYEYQPNQENNYETKLSNSNTRYSTPAPVTSNKQYVNQYQTENPYSSYTTQDLGLLDEITKKYFTLFGQKLNPDNTREITPTALPQTKQNYYDKTYYQNFENIAPVPTKSPSPNIQFPDVYNVQSDRPYYLNQQGYSTPKYRDPIRKQKPDTVEQTDSYSYLYGSNDERYQDYKDYDHEIVRPNHPLHSDVAVNYKSPTPTIDPDAELIDPAYLNPVPLNGNSYISYRLPGNSGHFYFLTPQTIRQQNYPHRNPRIRYQEIEKHGYTSSDVSHKILK